MVSLSRAERISFTIRNKRSWCCVLLDRLTERNCWSCLLVDGIEGFGGRHFFKDFGQKWKVRNGTVAFEKISVR